MNTIITNPCFRCGKERIISKTWKEILVTSSGIKQEIIHEEAVCPDKECQKLLNIEFAKQKEKRDKISSDREQRLQDKKNQLQLKKKKKSKE